jgi:plastocyanin
MKPSSLMFVAASALVVLALSSCGSSNNNNNNNNNDSGTVNACTDRTGSASPTVGIVTMGGAIYGGYAFSPMCVQINRGQSVTFTGNYSLHTIERTTQTVATATNPLPSTPYSGPSPVTFGPFPDAGDFNFYCSIHGFTGTVRVNP